MIVFFLTKLELPSKTTSQHLLWGSDRCLWFNLLIVIRFWYENTYMKLANKIFRPPSLHDDVRCHVFLKNLFKSQIYKLNQTENKNTCEYVAEVLKEKGFLFMCVFFWEKLVELGPVVLQQLCYAVSDASARIFQISLVLIFLASRDLVRCA